MVYIESSLEVDGRKCWDVYFLELAREIASRATCTRRKVGAVAVNQKKRIIGTGYNGSPSGLKHCTKDTCIRTINKIPSGQRIEVCRALHAEMNIVSQLGDKLNGATLYCTTKPCVTCLKLLMGVGIGRICWLDNYQDEFSDQMMEEYGVLRTIHCVSENKDEQQLKEYLKVEHHPVCSELTYYDMIRTLKIKRPLLDYRGECD